jgi:branched-chain amino acid transport system ATP-binding protein
MLRLEKVTAGYGATRVIEEVSFELAEHGSLAVLGRNGVGKTTLLATIMGHTNLQSGHLWYAGTEISALPIEGRALRGIGYVPQEREIFPSLTVEENLTVARRPGSWDLARIYDLFPNLAERRRNMGNQLSGGEQQMLSIGRTLMCNPSILLLDEPLEGLAPVLVDQLLLAIERIRHESRLAILLVDQQVRLVLEFSPEVIVLERGRIAFAGLSATLLGDRGLMGSLLGVGSEPSSGA